MDFERIFNSLLGRLIQQAPPPPTPTPTPTPTPPPPPTNCPRCNNINFGHDASQHKYICRTCGYEIPYTPPLALPPVPTPGPIRAWFGNRRIIRGGLKVGTRLVCRNARCGWVGTQGDVDANGGRCPRCQQTSFSHQRTGWGDFMLWGFYLLGLIGILNFYLGNLVSFVYSSLEPLFAAVGLGGATFWLTWFWILIAAAYVAYKLAQMNIRRGGFYFGIMILALILFSWFLLPIFSPGGITSPYLTTFGCILGNLANPGGLTACLQTGTTTQAPVAQKTGGYKALNIRFGSEFTEPKYQLQPMLWSEGYLLKYVFPLTIENPNDDLTIKDVKINEKESKITNETQYDPPIAWLVTNFCTEQKACELKPLEKLLLTIESNCTTPNKYCAGYPPPTTDDVPYGDKASKRPVGVELSVSYNFSNDGKNGLIFVKSAKELKNAPPSRPETGKGPVDVVVYFSPEKYLFDSGVKKVYVFINLMNKGNGNAFVKKVKVIRSSNEFLDASSVKCKVGAQSFTSEEIVKSISVDKNRQFPIICEYNLIPGSSLAEPYRTITFTTLVNFTYTESISQTVPIQIISK